MKKYTTTIRFIRYSKMRAKSTLKERLVRKMLKIRKNKSEQNLPESEKKYKRIYESKFREYERIKAPIDFSFKSNPIKVIEFINKVKVFFDLKRKIFVVLKDVETVDFDAIVVLLSIMIRFKSKNIDFNGDFPKNSKVNKVLTQSGFFKNLYKTFKDEERYSVQTEIEHSIHTHAFKSVDSDLGAEIIEQATKTIWGEVRRCQGAQRALLELMQNTNNHATIGLEGEKHWWLSVNHNKLEKRVSFSFVDYGVGVFKSLSNKSEGSKFFKAIDKMLERFKYGNNSEFLKLIMEGELHRTVTGEHFRGKGLPGIREALKRNQISNLVVITNDVYANVSNDEFRMLNSNFTGTFICWEINLNNVSCHG